MLEARLLSSAGRSGLAACSSDPLCNLNACKFGWTDALGETDSPYCVARTRIFQARIVMEVGIQGS